MFKPHFKIILISVLFLICFTALLKAEFNIDFVKYHSFPNGEIPPELQKRIAELDGKSIKLLKEKNFDGIFKILVKELQNQGIESVTKSLLPLSEEILKYETVQYYRSYIKFSSTGKGVSAIHSETQPPFYMHVSNSNKEMLVSLRVTCCEFTDKMFGFSYIKNEGDWKLAGIKARIYKVGGMDYQAWFKKSKETKSNGLPLSSFLMMTVANQIKRPLQYIQFKNEKEIDEYTKSLLEIVKGKIKLPIQYKSIEGRPTVFQLTTQFIKSEMYIKVLFKTDTVFERTKLESEAKEIHSQLSKVVPDLLELQDLAVYTAYHEIPNQKGVSYNNFTVIVDNNLK